MTFLLITHGDKVNYLKCSSNNKKKKIFRESLIRKTYKTGFSAESNGYALNNHLNHLDLMNKKKV